MHFEQGGQTKQENRKRRSIVDERKRASCNSAQKQYGAFFACQN
jgi:hypothetical protein